MNFLNIANFHTLYVCVKRIFSCNEKTFFLCVCSFFFFCNSTFFHSGYVIKDPLTRSAPTELRLLQATVGIDVRTSNIYTSKMCFIYTDIFTILGGSFQIFRLCMVHVKKSAMCRLACSRDTSHDFSCWCLCLKCVGLKAQSQESWKQETFFIWKLFLRLLFKCLHFSRYLWRVHKMLTQITSLSVFFHTFRHWLFCYSCWSSNTFGRLVLFTPVSCACIRKLSRMWNLCRPW